MTFPRLWHRDLVEGSLRFEKNIQFRAIRSPKNVLHLDPTGRGYHSRGEDKVTPSMFSIRRDDRTDRAARFTWLYTFIGSENLA